MGKIIIVQTNAELMWNKPPNVPLISIRLDEHEEGLRHVQQWLEFDVNNDEEIYIQFSENSEQNILTSQIIYWDAINIVLTNEETYTAFKLSFPEFF